MSSSPVRNFGDGSDLTRRFIAARELAQQVEDNLPVELTAMSECDAIHATLLDALSELLTVNEELATRQALLAEQMTALKAALEAAQRGGALYRTPRGITPHLS